MIYNSPPKGPEQNVAVFINGQFVKPFDQIKSFQYQKGRENQQMKSEELLYSEAQLNSRQSLIIKAQNLKPEPHKYLYSGSVLFVLGFYFVFIFLCKWRKDRKNKKPVQNQLVEQKTEPSQKPQTPAPTKQIQMVEMS